MEYFFSYLVILVISLICWMAYLFVTKDNSPQSPQKKFSVRIFFTALIIIMVLQLLSFLGAAGEDEMGRSRNFFWRFMSDSFVVFRFPTHTLLWNFFSRSGILFLFGLLLNCLIYSFLIERLFTVSKRVLRNQF